MPDALEWLTVSLGLTLVVGTLLGQLDHPHWCIRNWEFPRLQTAVLLLFVGVVHPLAVDTIGPGDVALLVAVGLAFVWQAALIAPFTPLARRQVEDARPATDDADASAATLSIVVSNVQMENEEHARWRDVVLAVDPDVIVAAEVDDAWMRALHPLIERYPHVVARPQDNCYGMAVLSRLPLQDASVARLVQDDIPSIHVDVMLPDGGRVHLVALHPRPPEPLRNQDAAPRDAELVLVGRDVDPDVPTIVVGDLNDVAWSSQTRLFLRLSGLLDPRRGRGLLASFSAKSRFWRFPLDHVFHSNHFRLVDLRLLDFVGSDHFPVHVVLRLEPDAPRDQPRPRPSGQDHQRAERRLERQAEREDRDADPHGGLTL